MMRQIHLDDEGLRKQKSLSTSGFEVHAIDGASEHGDQESSESSPSSTVKVRFDKFVQLVAMHDFEAVIAQNPAEEVVVSSNLLMDLANAQEDQPTNEKKTPMIFAVGLILGIAFTYILFKFF